MKQRNITFLLSILLSMVGLDVLAHDIEVKNSDGVTIYYTYQNNRTELSVSYLGYNPSDYSNEYSGNVVIPEFVTYNGAIYPVTSIGNYAFYGCSGLTSVTIPNSVTSIGDAAFSGCSGLMSITIPNSVTSIGSSAFNNSGIFQKAPDGVFYVDNWVCGYKGNMPNNTTLTLLDTTRGIGGSAFYGCSRLTSITIPNSVTSIGDYAFSWCIGLTSITIPNSVTSIGDYAFNHCSSLTSVTIPNSVTSIGYSAFYECSGLTSITIPNSVTSIGSSAFRDCSGLTSITIPNSVISIGYSAFYGCSGLTSITIPNSVTSIGGSAFSGCSGLTNAIIGNSVTNIGNDAFQGCSGLTNAIIGNSVTNIGNDAFHGCSGLTSITIPNSVTSIGIHAFVGCSGLTSVTIGNSVTSIGSSAFYECRGLTSITIPNSVTSIGGSAFYGCSGLTEVNYNATNCSEMGNYDYKAFKNCTSFTTLNIGENVQTIPAYAFSGCSGLTSVTIPNSVTSIGDYAFYGCSGLTSITIPNSVTSIGGSVFRGCSGLTNVIFHCKEIGSWFSSNSSIKNIVIGDEVTSIGGSAFKNCMGLTSLIIGSGVTSIGDNAFQNTNIIKTFWLTNTPPEGYGSAKGAVNYVSNNQLSSIKDAIVYPFLSSMFEVDGVVYVPVSPSDRTCDAIDFTYDESIINLKVGSTVSYKGVAMKVKNIMPYVFYNNKNIKEIRMEIDGNIYMRAFDGCSNLETAVIGKTAGYDAVNFRGCFIGENVAEIGDNTFDGCTSIKNIIIADREDELKLGSSGSNSLFAACPLDSVYIGGNISYQTEQKYGYSPFYRNTSLRTVVITDKETEISTNEFYGCTNLQSFTVGDGVESFGNWAFSGCKSLKSLSFGSHLKTIGKEAFSDCVSVTKIVSKAGIPPVCDTQALDDINKWECKLIVPQGFITTYQAADQWKDFFFMEEGDGGNDMPDTPDNKKCAKPTISYSNGKLTFSSETEGVEYLSTITDTDITTYNSSEIQLGVTYQISVYATKTGFDNSDVATATLCWIDVEPKTDDISDVVAKVNAYAVLIQNNGSELYIQGLDKGTDISVYNTAGQLVGSAKADIGITTISTTLRSGEVGIVKIGEKAIKVVMK